MAAAAADDEGRGMRHRRAAAPDQQPEQQPPAPQAAAAQEQEQEQEQQPPLLGRPMLLLFLLWVVQLFLRDSGAGQQQSPPSQPQAVVMPDHMLTLKPEPAVQQLSAAEDALMKPELLDSPLGSYSAAGGMRHVTVQYCMKRNFVELQRFLEHRFPELRGHIYGGNYPPPPYAMLLVTFVGYLQMATLVLMVVGRPLFRLCGFAAPPAWFEAMMENKMGTFACMLLANTMAASLTATGAFEVMYGEQVAFSKLAEGRMPTGDELIARFLELGLE